MRLDQWLFENKHFDSREKAKREILAGRVRQKGCGTILDKPGVKVPKGLEVQILELPRFVSRAGDKLEAFLDSTQISVESSTILDVGSSTGGFTDCCLQRGAEHVTAVDVGTNQLHEKLRQDPRVSLYEKTDIRHFDFSKMSKAPDWILVDVSFISVFLFLAQLAKRFPQAKFILLFKPQFETGREVAKKKGIVNQQDRLVGLEDYLKRLKALGFSAQIVEDSAVKGMKGNQETFVMAEFETPTHIFRTYDIRGHATNELSDLLFEKIGYILGRRLLEKTSHQTEKPRVGIGRDARESSPRLFEALMRGLSYHEIDLFPLGEVTTPMVYFANYQFNFDAAFQITASHNPAQDNGIKMMFGKDALFGDEIRSIGEEAAALILPAGTEKNSVQESLATELRTQYLNFLHQQFKFTRKFKLVADTANGMAGCILRDAVKPYCESLDILYEDVDCRFPNHEADPTVEANLKELQEKVSSSKADIGLAFDGDGDRLGVVSASGRIFWGDEILMLLSEQVLKQLPGASIIGEVKCSEKLFKMIKDRGGKPVMYKTGHSLIKKKMKELKAPIAGEMSGHLFFADRYFGFDDAVYAALRVMEVISEMDLNLDEWVSQFPKAIITPELRVEVAESEKEVSVKKMIQYFEKEPGVQLTLIDGVRASFQDGSWALVRASNTQAVLVVRIEATSEERLSELKSKIEEALGKAL